MGCAYGWRGRAASKPKAGRQRGTETSCHGRCRSSPPRELHGGVPHVVLADPLDVVAQVDGCGVSPVDSFAYCVAGIGTSCAGKPKAVVIRLGSAHQDVSDASFEYVAVLPCDAVRPASGPWWSGSFDASGAYHVVTGVQSGENRVYVLDGGNRPDLLEGFTQHDAAGITDVFQARLTPILDGYSTANCAAYNSPCSREVAWVANQDLLKGYNNILTYLVFNQTFGSGGPGLDIISANLNLYKHWDGQLDSTFSCEGKYGYVLKIVPPAAFNLNDGPDGTAESVANLFRDGNPGTEETTISFDASKGVVFFRCNRPCTGERCLIGAGVGAPMCWSVQRLHAVAFLRIFGRASEP